MPEYRGYVGRLFEKGYHIQAAWYNHVLQLCGHAPRDFEFIAVSKDAGHECTVVEYKMEECERVWTCLCMPPAGKLGVRRVRE
jgi:hypothetical protein